MDKDEGVLFVRFHTHLKEHVITEDSITIPSKLRRLGLSEVVNHLLGYGDKPIPFDFLINNQFLRTSLQKFIERTHTNPEEVIDIWYVLALGTPTSFSALQHDDWVSAIEKCQKIKHTKQDLIISGSYDSIIRFWKSDTQTNEPIFCLEGHTGPIKSLSSTKLNNEELVLVSASLDQTLKIWNVSLTSSIGKCTHNLIGHSGSVMSCDISPNDTNIASGSWDYNIKVWNMNQNDLDQDIEGDEQPNAPKRRKVEDVGKNKKAAATLSGHKQAVTAVKWTSNEEIVSGSWDYSIGFWDAESGIKTETKNSNKAIHSLDYSPKNQIVITSHSDYTIRLWDRRDQHLEAYIGFTSHKEWVSSVAFHPHRQEIFISGSYDNTIKVWDMRSTIPLYTLDNCHSDKVLTVGWWDENIFLSGGADNLLKTHILQ